MIHQLQFYVEVITKVLEPLAWKLSFVVCDDWMGRPSELYLRASIHSAPPLVAISEVPTTTSITHDKYSFIWRTLPQRLAKAEEERMQILGATCMKPI